MHLRHYTTSYLVLSGMAGVVLLISVNNSTFVYLAISSVPDQNATFGHLMSDPMWLDPPMVFYGANKVRSEAVRACF